MQHRHTPQQYTIMHRRVVNYVVDEAVETQLHGAHIAIIFYYIILLFYI